MALHRQKSTVQGVTDSKCDHYFGSVFTETSKSLIESFDHSSPKRKFLSSVSAFCTAEALDPCPGVFNFLCDTNESCLIDNNQLDWTPIDPSTVDAASLHELIRTSFGGKKEAFLTYIGAVCVQFRVDKTKSIIT